MLALRAFCSYAAGNSYHCPFNSKPVTLSGSSSRGDSRDRWQERYSLLRRLHEFYVDGMGASLDPLGQSILHLQGPAVSKIKCQHLLCEKVLLPGDSGLGLFQP